ncbi:MAG: ArsA family ATPase [Myxococcales bacterium]|nr:ArsA family ATPase [Myxococcales bacterium]
MHLPPLLQRRFVLVTGKGGVGKSTVSAVLARLSARAGRRTLVCELNTRERIPGLFGRPPVGGEVTRIGENLWSVNIQPDMAMEEYALMKLRFRTLYRFVFENPVVRNMVRIIPGVHHLLMMGKAFNHEREVEADGRPTWDTIIVDAPATGHGLTFFQLPRVIRDAVPAGNLHREAADMWALLTDPRRTAVHLVTLPEELPVRETLELHGRLTRDLGMPLGHLFVNMMPPPLFAPEQAELFARLPEPAPGTALHDLWATGRIRMGREALAGSYRRQLAGLAMPLVELPIMYTRDFGPEQIGALGDRLLEQSR